MQHNAAATTIPALSYQLYYSQDGSGGGTPTVPQWMAQETTKTAPFSSQWDNNSGYHVGGGANYGPGPGQVSGGGAQNRVGQQQPPPNQPTPTSTPPSMHADMSKQPLTQGQMTFVQQRPNMPTNFAFQQRGLPPQTQAIRPHNRQMYGVVPQVLAQAPAQTIAVQYPQGTLMYNTPRQGAGHYPNQAMYMTTAQHAQYAAAAAYQPQYFQPIMGPPQYTGLTSGGPSPQAPVQQPAVTLMRPSIPTVPAPAKTEPKKRTFALKIIDPKTNEEVAIDAESSANNNNITPTCSNDSSARQTPQPNAGGSIHQTDNTVAAEFAAKVAACALDSQSPSQPPSTPELLPVESVSASESEIVHKQPPLNEFVPNSERIVSTLSTSSNVFVPRAHMQPVVEVPSSEFQVPTVSEETDAPPVEITRAPVKPAPAVQSPMRNNKKPKSGEIERQSAPPMPAPSVDPVPNNKKGPKGPQKDENISVPKEKREKTRSVSKEQSPSPSPEVSQEIPVKEVAKAEESIIVPGVKTPHHNGETTTQPPEPVPPPHVPTSNDGNKSGKGKGKKGPNKMKDRKERDGSEMDSITSEPPTIMSEEKERPETPASPPPLKIPQTVISNPVPVPVTVPAVPPPPHAVAPPPEPAAVNKIQDDLEEKEDKMVAAKNEENTKVSSMTKPEVADKEPTPVAPVVEKRPQITLRHSYSKDQWSPLNPEGKKKYDRDFLVTLKEDPQSLKRPTNLPEVLLSMYRDNPNMMRAPQHNIMNRGDSSYGLPAFARSSQSQRSTGVPPKRGSQQGNKGGGGGNKGAPRVIHMSLSLNQDVKLKTVENAWKPNFLEGSAEKPEEVKQTEELFKTVRGILNKLTPQKFDKLVTKFKALPIDSEKRLDGVINLIFDKAVDEPSFSKFYASMCKICSKLEVAKASVDGKEEKVNFRKLLIIRCQTEFEKNKTAELDSEKWKEEINSCTDPEKKKELQLAYEEKERHLRMKSVGNIRFIGELFKLGMLTPTIMYRCIEHLLTKPDEESLECLCKLLTTIGKELEQQQEQQAPGSKSLNPYFQKMSELSQKKTGSNKVSSRVRFMLQDVIELRQSRWVPRREDNNPKTIEQINKEVELETVERNYVLSQAPPRMRQNDRQDGKRGNRGNNQNEEGWNTVGGNSGRFNKMPNQPFEPSKMQQSIKGLQDLDGFSFGGSHNYRFGLAAKTESKPTGFVSSNSFSALQRSDERKPPQPGMNNRRITPTPSIERDKERQRMMQGIVESAAGDGRSSRGSSAQREKAQPPSRGNSVPRQADNRESSVTRTQPQQDNQSKRPEDDEARRQKLERQTITLYEEYITDCSTIDDVRQEVEQIFTNDTIGDFIEKVLEMIWEKKPPAQRKIGDLFTGLMAYSLLPQEVLVEKFANIYEFADDVAIDVPKIWELQAYVIAPILAAERINLSHFRTACNPVLKSRTATNLLLPVLSLLVSEKGPGFVRKVWDSSNVSLKDFLPPEEDVDSFIKKNSLEYLTGEAPKYEATVAPLDHQIQETIYRLIQTSQHPESIFDFISKNVGERVEDTQFIRALVTAICEACMNGSKTTLDVSKFKQYEKLIQRYVVDTNEERELASLSAAHMLVCRLEHPQGLLHSIFNQFFEDSLICCESFLKWRDDDKEKLENKGVSVMSLNSFFNSLETTEVETDEEDS